jgi:hypothetical protein
MTTSVETREPITILDRCDKCGAAAMVRATLASGELFFCGHHGREVATPLVLAAIDVYDPEGVFNYGQQ